MHSQCNNPWKLVHVASAERESMRGVWSGARSGSGVQR